VAHQLQGRNIILGLGQEVHGQKPVLERPLRGLEDRAGDLRALPPTAITLPVRSPLALKTSVPRITTSRPKKQKTTKINGP
jgi:hypothetical protein